MTKFLQRRLIFFKYFSFLSILFFIQGNLFSQAKFSAVCSDKKIGKNDYLQIQFVVENASNVQNITPPSFKNFSIVSGPNQQSGMSSINGNVKQYVSIDFVLKPQATGSFTIGAATAKADGKEFHSNPVTIEVNNSSSPAKSGGAAFSSPFNMNFDLPTEPAVHEYDDYILHKGENLEEKVKKNLFIKVDVNKTSCYVGEPIVATYKLYTRLKSESSLTKTPSFNGFSVSEMGTPANYSLATEKYNGRNYSVYTLRKVQLYPLQSGTFYLEPVEVENKITFLKAEYAGARKGDMFYDMLRDFADANSPGDAVEQVTLNLKSTPQPIVVKPLPELNKPSDFKGAIGNFKINAHLEKSNITTDDAGNLKIIIAGSGNIQLINAPVVSWPDGIEGFDPKSSENIDKMSVPIKGEKVFTYPFTAAKPGDYEISKISFSYFDITTLSYKSISTQTMSVHVDKGTGNPSRLQNILKADKKTNDDRFIDKIYDHHWFIFGGLLFLTTLMILLTKKSEKKNQSINLSEVINNHKNIEQVTVPPPEFTIPTNPLAEAEKILSENNTSAFYHVLDVSLKKYLSKKLDVPVEELTKKKINERLDKCNVGIGTTLLLNSLLEDIELNLYAPVASANQMEDVYEKANEFVGLLEKQVC